MWIYCIGGVCEFFGGDGRESLEWIVRVSVRREFGLGRAFRILNLEMVIEVRGLAVVIVGIVEVLVSRGSGW